MCTKTGKEDTVEELIKSLEIIESGTVDTNALDTTIVQRIEKEDFSDWKLFQAKHFEFCFLNGMNMVLMKLLVSGHKDKYQSCFKKGYSLLMKDFRASEEVVTKVLNLYVPQISDSLEDYVPQTNENLLHLLLKKAYQNAIVVLIETYNIKKLYFSKNVAADIPLNIATSK